MARASSPLRIAAMTVPKKSWIRATQSAAHSPESVRRERVYVKAHVPHDVYVDKI